jgi:hypothetical protein
MWTGFGLVTRFVDHLQMVTASDRNSFNGLHTLKITVTASHIESTMSSLVVSL